jgi:hypothetical protein
MEFAAVVTILKLSPLLAVPPAVTTTFPVVAPVGTFTTINESDQLMSAAEVPLNVTVPGADPKPDPEIFTVRPGTPAVGDRPEMLGFCACVMEVECPDPPPQAASISNRQMGMNRATIVAPERIGVNFCMKELSENSDFRVRRL